MDALGTDRERQGSGGNGSVDERIRAGEEQNTSAGRVCMGRERATSQIDNIRIDLDDSEEEELSKRHAMPTASLPQKNGLAMPEQDQFPFSRCDGLDAACRNHPNRPDDFDDDIVDTVAVQLEEDRLFGGEAQLKRQCDRRRCPAASDLLRSLRITERKHRQ
ncbi:hypothetical protein FI667_g3736, partial [Globisporangium splendens]